ncbi:BatD family protein [Mesonia sp. K7]|uniref:BatD family protein n=1 Tax=Mesonia sp. K7 TaxID=2218606 RepID=UPI000DA8B0EE|nr:BatD family protein [Mesonia sp. K7]PZD79031.1 protein BatD [Mesonia sp. K7]
MKSKLLYILVFFIGFFAQAQVKFEAKVSRNTIGLNERVRVDFTMNQDGDNFNPPDFRGFQVVGGPFQSISNSWINGKKSYEKSYGYYLQPNSRGKFTIGQAEIQIGGKTYKTTPIEVEVVAAVNNPTDGNNAEITASQNIHLVTKISDETPYLNEGISVEYILYVSPNINVSQWRALNNPTFPDFWSQNIDINQLNVKQGTFQGEPYRYVTLRKTILYPQKIGELKIEPLTLSVSVDVPSDKRDFFGRRLYETVQQRVAAQTRTIEVRPLPTEGKPVNFSGAVGSFNFSVTTNRETLDAGEALEASVKVSGNGNLMLFQLPKLDLPSSLEVYEPQHQEDINTNLNGVYGSISDNYTIVPQQKGKFPISPVSFSYFDTRSETYRTITSNQIVIDVENGPLNSGNQSASVGTTKNLVEAGNQFRYIQLKPKLKEIGKEDFFESTWFWVLLLFPLLLIPIGILAGRKYINKQNDQVSNNVKKADKLARKYLSEAKSNIGENTIFYVALEKALHNYLKAKLRITTSEMSKENIRKALAEKGASEANANEFIGLLENCEMARYSPTTTGENTQVYERATEVLPAIDKEL